MSLMKIPSRVRIKSKIEYEVVYLNDFKDETQMGECRFNPDGQRQIVIKSGLSETDTIKTFIHEVVHAIDMENKIGLTEKQVLKLEDGIYRVLKLNGEL